MFSLFLKDDSRVFSVPFDDFLYARKLFRIDIRKGEVFKLFSDAPHTEPVRYRDVDLECLASNSLLLFGRDMFKRLHVVETVD
jgi:hypothetical protein